MRFPLLSMHTIPPRLTTRSKYACVRGVVGREAGSLSNEDVPALPLEALVVPEIEVVKLPEVEVTEVVNEFAPEVAWSPPLMSSRVSAAILPMPQLRLDFKKKNLSEKREAFFN